MSSETENATSNSDQYIQNVPITVPTNIPPTRIVIQEDYDRLRARADRLEIVERRFGELEQATNLSVVKDLLLVFFSFLVSEIARTPLGQWTFGTLMTAITSLAALVVVLYLYYRGFRRTRTIGE